MIVVKKNSFNEKSNAKFAYVPIPSDEDKYDNLSNHVSQGNLNNYIIEEFDEVISFYHSSQLFRKFEIQENNDRNNEFPLLVNNEFIIGTSNLAPIETDKNFCDLNNKEILQTVITRVKQFSVNDDVIFKQLFLDNLTSYAQKIGLVSTVDLIIPVLSKIADEVESIKIKFLQVFPAFFEFILSNGDKSYGVKLDMLKLITELFSDVTDLEMVQLATNDFVIVAKHLKREDIGTLVLSTILGFANEDGEESVRIESRSLATKLFGELAECLGKDYCEQFVIPQMAFLADDSHFKVRKSVAMNLVNCSNLVNYAVFSNKVMPFYKNLSTDILWTVRKACVEILPSMMKLSKEKSAYSAKNEDFINIFTNFMYDSQKYVRSAAIEILGQFLYALDKDELDEKFLNFYKNTLEQYYFNVKEFGIETETNYYNNVIYNSAYNFPSVLYCYGKSYWSKLRDIYANMANNKNENVKRSIISSFHEVSKIIGTDLLESDLLTIYDSFLSRKNEELRTFALKNLPNIIKLMKPQTRAKYLQFLPVHDKQSQEKNASSKKNKFNWRKKIEILEGYSNYFDLFDSEFIWNKILPLCVQFCLDNVFAVRKYSAKIVSKILKHFIENNSSEFNDKVKVLLENFAFSKWFNLRVTFLYMTREIIKSEMIYHQILKNCFTVLVKDKIVDTRVTLALMCSKIIKKNNLSHVIGDPDFLKICKILSNDPKNCVSQYFKNAVEINQEQEQESNFNNGLFINDIEWLQENFSIKIEDALLNRNNNNKSELNNSPKKKCYIVIDDERY